MFVEFRSRRASQSYQNAILEVMMPPEMSTSSMLLLESVSPCTFPLPINSPDINLILTPFAETLVETRLLGI